MKTVDPAKFVPWRYEKHLIGCTWGHLIWSILMGARERAWRMPSESVEPTQ
ncbi:hypothetical protein E8E12_006172 [Didymella heteroderae]|uniref:Uncharacterized protein n=1 Tax=Didymella heteroderae TaxID=1769908 RepID=A0A9P5C206_9PLEO|nr:hypothetical protein E8E12_006172 [Didymella heteroderae]